MLPETMRWLGADKGVELLDQRILPARVEFRLCKTAEDVAVSIEDMTVRGAPAIGAAAAFGLAIAASLGRVAFNAALSRMAATRPTAVNLFWAIERMKRAIDGLEGAELAKAAEREAVAIFNGDVEINRKLSEYGSELLPQKATVITHCNAGAIATCGVGTALGMLRVAREQGKEIKVYADETRPRLQGARLTAWEMATDGFDITLICDSMAAFLMTNTKIDAVIIGADRVAGNGDTANKIGSYNLAVAARRHKVPFYVAAPLSTIDVNCKTGADIPIEERDADEVRKIEGNLITTSDMKVWNPAFDVTPAELITAIVTEKGVVYPPFNLSKIK